MERGEQITLPVYVVYGSRGERLAVGEVLIQRSNGKFIGTFMFDANPTNEAAMDSCRSVTNQP